MFDSKRSSSSGNKRGTPKNVNMDVFFRTQSNQLSSARVPIVPVVPPAVPKTAEGKRKGQTGSAVTKAKLYSEQLRLKNKQQ